jgi:hypothetical protein
VFGDAGAGVGFAGVAGRELGAVLARDHDARRWGRFELVGIDVPPARDAVDVLVLVLVGAGGLRFLFALGESLLPLNHVGPRAFHDYGF